MIIAFFYKASDQLLYDEYNTNSLEEILKNGAFFNVNNKLQHNQRMLHLQNTNQSYILPKNEQMYIELSSKELSSNKDLSLQIVDFIQHQTDEADNMIQQFQEKDDQMNIEKGAEIQTDRIIREINLGQEYIAKIKKRKQKQYISSFKYYIKGLINKLCSPYLTKEQIKLLSYLITDSKSFLDEASCLTGNINQATGGHFMKYKSTLLFYLIQLGYCVKLWNNISTNFENIVNHDSTIVSNTNNTTNDPFKTMNTQLKTCLVMHVDNFTDLESQMLNYITKIFQEVSNVLDNKRYDKQLYDELLTIIIDYIKHAINFCKSSKELQIHKMKQIKKKQKEHTLSIQTSQQLIKEIEIFSKNKILRFIKYINNDNQNETDPKTYYTEENIIWIKYIKQFFTSNEIAILTIKLKQIKVFTKFKKKSKNLFQQSQDKLQHEQLINQQLKEQNFAIYGDCIIVSQKKKSNHSITLQKKYHALSLLSAAILLFKPIESDRKLIDRLDEYSMVINNLTEKIPITTITKFLFEYINLYFDKLLPNKFLNDQQFQQSPEENNDLKIKLYAVIENLSKSSANTAINDNIKRIVMSHKIFNKMIHSMNNSIFTPLEKNLIISYFNFRYAKNLFSDRRNQKFMSLFKFVLLSPNVNVNCLTLKGQLFDAFVRYTIDQENVNTFLINEIKKIFTTDHITSKSEKEKINKLITKLSKYINTTFGPKFFEQISNCHQQINRVNQAIEYNHQKAIQDYNNKDHITKPLDTLEFNNEFSNIEYEDYHESQFCLGDSQEFNKIFK